MHEISNNVVCATSKALDQPVKFTRQSFETLAESRDLPRDLTCVPESEPSKIDINGFYLLVYPLVSTSSLKAVPGKLEILSSLAIQQAFSKLCLVNLIYQKPTQLPIGSLFKLTIMDVGLIIDFVSIQRHWRRHSKVQRHNDLIKTYAMR